MAICIFSLMRYEQNVEMAFSVPVGFYSKCEPSRDLNFNTVNFAPTPELYRNMGGGGENPSI